MTNDKKIFLIKCNREEIINRPTIEFVELTLEELLFMKLLVKGQNDMNKLELGLFLNLIITIDKEALLKKLEEIL